MASQLNSAVTKFALNSCKKITETPDFISATLDKLYIQFEKNSLGVFQITYCEKLVGEKYRVCNNYIQEINEIRINSLKS